MDRTFWVNGAAVSAAEQNGYLAGAVDELDAYGTRYQSERAEIGSLESIPLTDATVSQRATAYHDVQALDTFFHTPAWTTDCRAHRAPAIRRSTAFEAELGQPTSRQSNPDGRFVTTTGMRDPP